MPSDVHPLTAVPARDHANFAETVERCGGAALKHARPRTLQVNVGKLCNQACHHCHVDAGPRRSERMDTATAERVIELLAASASIETVDLTGGAPELNPNFRFLVESARALSRNVIVRCNLTVMLVQGMDYLAEFYRANRVRLVCSLPCYTAENVAKQRGSGVFEKSIEALQILNALGYGRGTLTLDLVYNPVGPRLPPDQNELEAQYRAELQNRFGITFDRLLTITNMPISRFAAQLHRWGRFDEYMELLVNHFNPATVAGLMCRELVSVGWDGRLYDCDFNQMLGLRLGRDAPLTIWDVEDVGVLKGAPIITGSHCFGCTAGAGSSCGGALS
jgi:radical SAM/Cys-rich protein